MPQGLFSSVWDKCVADIIRTGAGAARDRGITQRYRWIVVHQLTTRQLPARNDRLQPHPLCMTIEERAVGATRMSSGDPVDGSIQGHLAVKRTDPR